MTTDSTSQSEVPIACNINAISAEQRPLHEHIAEEIFSAVEVFESVPDGYKFRLPPQSTILMKVAEFISNERLCCPFLKFTVEIEPNHGAFWLSLSGNEEVKALIKSTFIDQR